MVHLGSPYRVPLLQATGRVVARLQEDQCHGVICCLWSLWGGVVLPAGTGGGRGRPGSQGCLPCLAAPLLQLPDELQEVHLQGELLGCRWAQGVLLSPGRTRGSSLLSPGTRGDLRAEGEPGREPVESLAAACQKGAEAGPRPAAGSAAALAWHTQRCAGMQGTADEGHVVHSGPEQGGHCQAGSWLVLRWQRPPSDQLDPQRGCGLWGPVAPGLCQENPTALTCGLVVT